MLQCSWIAIFRSIYVSFSWHITHNFFRMQSLDWHLLYTSVKDKCLGSCVALSSDMQGRTRRPPLVVLPVGSVRRSKEAKALLIRWKLMLSYLVSDTEVGNHEFKRNSSRLLQCSSSEADIESLLPCPASTNHWIKMYSFNLYTAALKTAM